MTVFKATARVVDRLYLRLGFFVHFNLIESFSFMYTQFTGSQSRAARYQTCFLLQTGLYAVSKAVHTRQ